jgi:hypothetical protein
MVGPERTRLGINGTPVRQNESRYTYQWRDKLFKQLHTKRFLLISTDETEDPKQANVASGHTTGAEGVFSDEEGAVSEVKRYLTALPRVGVTAPCASQRNVCPAHHNTGAGERRQRIEMLNTRRRRNVRVRVWSGWFKTTCAAPSTGTMLTSDFILPLRGVLRGVF